MTQALKESHEAILDLRLETAERLLHDSRLSDPNNLMVDFFENYVDFFKVFIGEESDEFESFTYNVERRLRKIARAEEGSPFYLFCQAEILLQSALVRLKFEEYLGAFLEISRAYRMLESNKERFPDFSLNNKSLGVLHAVIGSIPDQYRWGLNILGLDGSIQKGSMEIREVIDAGGENNDMFRQEALVMYAFVGFYLSGEEGSAWELMDGSDLNETKSLLATFVKANFAMKTGRTDKAIKILEERPHGSDYYSFYYLDFLLGTARMNQLDCMANKDLRKFVDNFKGRNYIKDAYRKLAWHDMLFEEGTNYNEYVTSCMTKGYHIVDEDKSALRFALQEERPNPILLKARLKFDGGYFEEVLEYLKTIEPAALTSTLERIEYDYRKARAHQMLKESEEALIYYSKVLEYSLVSDSYMIANSELQTGLIYENDEQFEKASIYFMRCIEFDPDQYASSLNQKARAGLERIKSR
jgi:tetratricopeptide (TPR) repeat protein